MMDSQLPEGWQRIEEESGEVYFLTRQPQVKISKKCQLDAYHKKGRYLEMRLCDLNFGKKRRIKKYSYTAHVGSNETTDTSEKSDKKLKADFDDPVDPGILMSEPPPFEEPETDDNIPDESNHIDVSTTVGEACNLDQFSHWRDGKRKVDENLLMEEGLDLVKLTGFPVKSSEDTKKDDKLNVERVKLVNAVKKLTVRKEDVIDHQKALFETAQVLNSRRKNLEDLDLDDINLEDLKAKIDASENFEELLLILNGSSLIQKKLSMIVQSRILEQLLRISSLPENPLKEFSMDINKNNYSEVVNFAVEHAPDVLDLIMKLSIKNEAPVAENDII